MAESEGAANRGDSGKSCTSNRGHAHVGVCVRGTAVCWHVFFACT